MFLGFLGFGLMTNALPPLIQKNRTQASMTNLAEFLIIISCCCLPKISISIKSRLLYLTQKVRATEKV